YTYNRGIIGFTNDNKLYLGKISTEEAINMGIRDAVEFGPFLIVNGESAFINGNGGYGYHPRTAIAQRQDGIVLFLVIDGRSIKSRGADLNEMVDILLRYHAYNAANLDGGNSSALVINNELINHPINWDNMEKTRPIPDGFIVTE
ncbi:MAG: phosphodiester glycosidase family protein, partial [Bacilli bacterium]|nr:phosphodiester glycosidase family protein [Bacilli bacterium]